MCENMEDIRFKPIGFVRSPFKENFEVPIQSSVAHDTKGTVEIFPEYEEGLADLDGFSHIILIYHFHFSRDYSLKVQPYLDYKLYGVFSTRSPMRPNPIGISVVRLTGIDKNKLKIEDIDILDGTPVLDIKPHVKEFDCRKNIKIGWLAEHVHKLNLIDV